MWWRDFKGLTTTVFNYLWIKQNDSKLSSRRQEEWLLYVLGKKDVFFGPVFHISHNCMIYHKELDFFNFINTCILGLCGLFYCNSIWKIHVELAKSSYMILKTSYQLFVLLIFSINLQKQCTVKVNGDLCLFLVWNLININVTQMA